MTEEAKTTESGADVAPESTEQQASTQATQPAPKSIFDGFTAEDKAYLEKKGWTEENYAVQSLKAYRILEKMMGGSKDIVEFPKEGDAEGYNALLKRMGYPEAKENYSYDVGDDKEKATAVEALRDVAFKSKMTQSQFNDFVGAFIEKDAEMVEMNRKAFIDAKKQELNQYAAEKGKDFAGIKNSTDRALRMYGITEEERLGLENGIGIKRFYDLFGTIGKHLQEGNLVSSANDSVTKTSESYKLELDKLFSDREFMTKYMSGDTNALAMVNDLNNKISGAR